MFRMEKTISAAEQRGEFVMFVLMKSNAVTLISLISEL